MQIVLAEKSTTIGFGIFIWESEERRSNRYGTFNLVDQDYNNTVTVENKLDEAVIAKLKNKRVKLIATVIENRASGHIGDMFLKVYPSMPELNERIVLGVGKFFSEKNACGLAIGLKPKDKRSELWLDPRVLYRLHDQTVEISYELTSEDDHVVKSFEDFSEGVQLTDDGLFQSKGKGIVGVKRTMNFAPVEGAEHCFEAYWVDEPLTDK